MLRPLTAALLTSLLAACGPDLGPLADTPVAAAQLQDLDLSSLSVIGGVTAGDAVLVFSTPRGGAGSIPVALSGPQLGLALDLAVDPEGHEGAVELDVSDVDGNPTVGQLMGTYRGTKAGGAAVVGSSARRMRNRHGVSFRESHLQLGMSLFAGVEWLTVRPGGNDGSQIEAEPERQPSASDTGRSPPEAAPAFTEVDPGGCGRPQPRPGEPVPTPTDTADSAGTGPGPTPTTTEPTTTEPEAASSTADGGCSGEGGGCGCDGDSGDCDGCSTLPVPAAPMMVCLAALRRRRWDRAQW